MIPEIIIVSIIGSIWMSYNFFHGNDTVTLNLFFIMIVVLTVCLVIPDIRIITVIVLGIGWACPFIYLAGIFGGIFYVLAFAAFVMCCIVHYYALTYLSDLTRKDE